MKLKNIVYFIFLIAFTLLLVREYMYSDSICRYMAYFENSARYDQGDKLRVNDSERFEYIAEYNSFEEAVDAIGYSPIKEYLYENVAYVFVLEDFYADEFTLYKYDITEKKLYKVLNQVGGISIKHPIEDGDDFDYDFASNLIARYEKGHYIAADGMQEDVYYGTWPGEEIKNISFENGKFEYSLIGQRETGTNIYFWTYELKDSADLFDKLEKYEGTEPEARVYIRIRDVKKLLGIKIKYQFDYRIVIYLAIMSVFLTVTAALILLTYKLNNMDGIAARLVYLLWIVTAFLCVITVIMIIYFVLNPQLIFGELTYINETFYNITGHYLPNPSKGMYEW